MNQPDPRRGRAVADAAAAALLSLILSLLAGCGSSGAPTQGASTAAMTPTVPTSQVAGDPSTPMPPVESLPASPATCPTTSGVTAAASLLPGLLPSTSTMLSWEQYMVNLGPRFTGSPANRAWQDFIVAQLKGAGLTVTQQPIAIDWWLHRKWSLTMIENGVSTDVPVASYYPYSGHTPEGGITADTVDVGSGTPAEIEAASVKGKIAFEQVDLLPTKVGIFYPSLTYINDPDMTITPATDYTRMSFSILVPQISLLTPSETGSLTYDGMGGAVGAVIALDVSKLNLDGQYTPFGGAVSTTFGVPALYVDQTTGAMLKTHIAAGAQLKLELVVDQHTGDSIYDIVATLPGMSDEVEIINTHTDGTSGTEENGAIGLISLARYFAALPKQCRARTMVFVAVPGHFNGSIGGDTDRFIARHPEIMAKSVASLTMEHLGEMEWLDDATGYHGTGLPEIGVFFGSPVASMQTIMANAVMAENLKRTIVLRPIGPTYFGVGATLNLHGVPNAAYLTGPNALYSFADNSHFDQISGDRMANEIRVFTRVASAIDSTATPVLCAGMPPSEDPNTPVPCGTAGE